MRGEKAGAKAGRVAGESATISSCFDKLILRQAQDEELALYVLMVVALRWR